jgi:hypothetical protein
MLHPAVRLEEKFLGLARYDAMLTAIAKCHAVDEALKIKQTARALEIYAAQARNTEAENRAAEIRYRAERRTGELLKETAKLGQRQTGKRPPNRQSGNTTVQKTGSRGGRLPQPKLKDLGLSKDQSSRYQKMAQLKKGGRVTGIFSLISASDSYVSSGIGLVSWASVGMFRFDSVSSADETNLGCGVEAVVGIYPNNIERIL